MVDPLLTMFFHACRSSTLAIRPIFRATLAALTLAGLPVELGCKTKSDALIIGAVLPLSGADSTYGIDLRDGTELALQQVNAKGGIKGKKVQILFNDDKSNPQDTSMQVRQLIEGNHVIALLGEVVSSRSMTAGLIANTKKIPMVNPSATAVEVTKDREYVFRTCYTNPQQGSVAARFAYDTLQKTAAGILFASQDTYSSGLAQSFKERFVRSGGRVVIEKGFQKGETNFTTYLQELKSANTDVVFVPVFYKDMIQIARQAKQVGIPSSTLIGGDGWDSIDLLAAAGSDLEGAYFTNHYAPDAPWENMLEFKKAFHDKFNREPVGFNAQGYDSAMLLFDAMARASELTPEAIKNAIAETKDFAASTGSMSMDKFHNPSKPIVVVQVKGNAFHYYTQLVSE